MGPCCRTKGKTISLTQTYEILQFYPTACCKTKSKTLSLKLTCGILQKYCRFIPQPWVLAVEIKAKHILVFLLLFHRVSNTKEMNAFQPSSLYFDQTLIVKQVTCKQYMHLKYCIIRYPAATKSSCVTNRSDIQ